MKKLSVVVLSIFVLMTSIVKSQQPPTPTVSPGTPQKDLTWLMSKIHQGKQQLADLPLSHSSRVIHYRTGLKKSVTTQSTKATKRKGKGGKGKSRKPSKKTYFAPDTDWASKEFGLAVLEPFGDRLELIKARKDEQKLVVLSAGFQIGFDPKPSGRTWNGKNTAFAVEDQQHRPWLVVAIKWLEKPKSPVAQSIYVPYSRALHLRALILAGQAHFRADIAEAFTRLNRLGVRSLVEPEQLVTRRFTPSTFEWLEQMEQSDPEEFLEFRQCGCPEKLKMPQSDDLAKEIKTNAGPYIAFSPFERAQIRFVNGEEEFKTKNFAGAVGPMQFTNNKGKTGRGSGTWDVMRRKYPLAGLPVFEIGAIDHVYSVMAAILLHDSNTDQLVRKFGRGILADPDLLAYLAAAYNGGLGTKQNPRVMQAIEKGGRNWRNYLTKHETQIYVQEWDWLQSH